MDLSGRQDDIDMLKAAVAALEARLAALEAAGGMAAAAPPPAPPAGTDMGGVALAKVRLVTGLDYSSSSTSSGWRGQLSYRFRDVFVHVGRSSSSGSSDSSAVVVNFVPEEI